MTENGRRQAERMRPALPSRRLCLFWSVRCSGTETCELAGLGEAAAVDPESPGVELRRVRGLARADPDERPSDALHDGMIPNDNPSTCRHARSEGHPRRCRQTPTGILRASPTSRTAHNRSVSAPAVTGGSSAGSFNEAHVLAITQAISDYRSGQGITGPLFIGKDTHALSELAFSTALEVLAANGVEP